MVGTRSGRARRVREEPERSTSTSANDDVYQALMDRIEELERNQREAQPQTPAPNIGTKHSRRLTRSMEFSFDGTVREGHELRTWLSRMDMEIRWNARGLGGLVDEEDKLLLAEMHLGGTAIRQYDAQVQSNGPFQTYQALTDWLRATYVASDSLARTRQQYRHCIQRPNETIEQYYLRFTEIVNKLDKKPEESWQVSDFVEGLDAEHAELLAKYGDISTYEGVTVQEVRSRLTRTLRLKKAGGSGAPKGPEQRVSTKSKPRFKTTTKNTTISTEPLSQRQKQRLEDLIQKGGGQFVGRDVRNVQEWWKMATDKGVCGNCAAKGHTARYCPLEQSRNGNGNNGNGKKKKNGKGDKLNAMIPDYAAALGSELQADLEYLCSLAENVPLAMFPCSIETSAGIAILDTAATRVYISLSYARRAKLVIQPMTTYRPIWSANRQTM